MYSLTSESACERLMVWRYKHAHMYMGWKIHSQAINEHTWLGDRPTFHGCSHSVLLWHFFHCCLQLSVFIAPMLNNVLLWRIGSFAWFSLPHNRQRRRDTFHKTTLNARWLHSLLAYLSILCKLTKSFDTSYGSRRCVSLGVCQNFIAETLSQLSHPDFLKLWLWYANLISYVSRSTCRNGSMLAFLTSRSYTMTYQINRRDDGRLDPCATMANCGLQRIYVSPCCEKRT